MSKVISTIDLSGVAGLIGTHGERGVRVAVEFLLTEANKHVPHDEGTLERSGQASVDGTRGAVSYDTPYAVRQHEDMSMRHDGKGEAKWLETTFGRERQTVAGLIAQAIRSGVGS